MHVQVDLILMGERYREMLQQGIHPVQQAQTDRNASGFADNVSKLQNTVPFLPQLCVSASPLQDLPKRQKFTSLCSSEDSISCLQICVLVLSTPLARIALEEQKVAHGACDASAFSGVWAYYAQELPGMRVLFEKLRDPHSSSGYEEHGLFLFPNTDAGWLATVSCTEMPPIASSAVADLSVATLGSKVKQTHATAGAATSTVR